jgi:hypothetical protein
VPLTATGNLNSGNEQLQASIEDAKVLLITSFFFCTANKSKNQIKTLLDSASIKDSTISSLREVDKEQKVAHKLVPL